MRRLAFVGVVLLLPQFLVRRPDRNLSTPDGNRRCEAESLMRGSNWAVSLTGHSVRVARGWSLFRVRIRILVNSVFAYDRSREASSHSSLQRTPAGRSCASFADCPAHICITSVSPFFCADSRMPRVSARCTGYGAGQGAFAPLAARAYAFATPRPGRPLNARVTIVSWASVRAS